MGITSVSLHRLKRLIDEYKPKKVCDFGAQNIYLDKLDLTQYDPMKESKQWIEQMGFNLYNQAPAGKPMTPAPFVSEMWKYLQVGYFSIDMNKQNGSLEWDLGEPLPTSMVVDFVMDYGTSEHIMNLYQCFLNAHDLCKVGGLMIHENPETNNWPSHGFHFFTTIFYRELANAAGYNIIDINKNPASGNTIDGWNVYCVLQKTRDEFIPKNQFPKHEIFTK